MNVLDDPFVPSGEPLCSSLATGELPDLKCLGSLSISTTSGGRATSASVSAAAGIRQLSRATPSPTSPGFAASSATLNPYLTPLANHNARLFGSSALLLVFVGVFVGRRFVARVSCISLVCLLLALLAVFIGLLVPLAHNEDSLYAIARIITLIALAFLTSYSQLSLTNHT